LGRTLAIEPPWTLLGGGALARGRVLLGALIGVRATLRAMKLNEDDTVLAYERLVANPSLPPSILDWARSNLEDERRHRAWIQLAIDDMSGSTPYQDASLSCAPAH
jgi:GTP-sensing pleiotropic transcriptional regulator CodY